MAARAATASASRGMRRVDRTPRMLSMTIVYGTQRPSGGCVAQALVDDVGERPAGEKALQVAEEDVEGAREEVGQVTRHVRCQDHVVERPVRMVRGQRLLDEDVEPRASDGAVAQGVDQRGI